MKASQRNRRDVLEIGELRGLVAREVQRSIMRLVDRKYNTGNRRPYFILVHGNRVPGRVLTAKTTLMVMWREPPVPMTGTILLYVDPRTGQIFRKRTLPLDFPKSEAMLEENTGKGGREVFEDATAADASVIYS